MPFPIKRSFSSFKSCHSSIEFFERIPLNASIIALDIGTRRTGVARSDRTLSHAIQVCTLEMDQNGIVDPRIESKLRALFNLNDLCGLIVGNPIGLDGLESKQAKMTKLILSGLAAKFDLHRLPIFFKDERYSTQYVKRTYDTALGKDELTACLLLQEYLDFRRSKLNPGVSNV